MIDGPLAGARIELEVGPVAHGGHCAARYEGRVVFVRHALPGERVVALVTEDRGGAFCRADAVQVLDASVDRVVPPCPYARPGGCGGCDFQHASPAAQRALKAAVVTEQLERLGGLSAAGVAEVFVGVEELPGGPLGWRTRTRFAVDDAGRPGFRRHRSHEVVAVESCAIAHPAVTGTGLTGHLWPDAAEVEAVAGGTGDRALLVTPRPGIGAVRLPDDLDPGLAVLVSGPGRAAQQRGHRRVRETAAGRRWLVAADGFWQVHPAAADTLVGAVLAALDPRPGESALDLYAGAGLFAGVLAAAVGAEGAGGTVTAVESDRSAVDDARRNLRDTPWVTVVRGRVDAVLRRTSTTPVDVVVLDPPRSGAGASVVRAIAARRPRAVAYVACDPAGLARDVRTFAGLGYVLTALRAFDLFPMTHHVECVATFAPGWDGP